MRGRDSLEKIDSNFVTGVQFSGASIAQVNGYYLQDNRNNIQFSICRIDSRWPEDLINAQAFECLVRSLGLPSLSKLNNRSLLGEWNKPIHTYNETFFNSIEERKNAFLKEKFGNKEVPADLYQQGFMETFVSSLPKYKFPDHLVRTSGLESNITEYDRFMLKILYCDSIKSGMTAYEIISILSTNNNRCLLNATGAKND